MKLVTKTERVGEYLGPIDWDYDFMQHAWTSDRGGTNPECVKACVEMLRQITGGGEWSATTDGGMPRCGWGTVLQVGMYDGWPFWTPTPSVLIAGFLGASWHPFTSLSEVRQGTTK